MGVLALMNPALPNLLVTYAVCTVALLFNVKIGNFSSASSAEHPPEDAFLKMPEPPPEIKRYQRLVMNNLENIPYDALLFWVAFVAVLAQSIAGAGSGGQQEALALNVLLPIYSAARISFTVCYLRALQPYRTLSFVVGTCCVVAAGGVLLSSTAKAYSL